MGKKPKETKGRFTVVPPTTAPLKVRLHIFGAIRCSPALSFPFNYPALERDGGRSKAKSTVVGMEAKVESASIFFQTQREFASAIASPLSSNVQQCSA